MILCGRYDGRHSEVHVGGVMVGLDTLVAFLLVTMLKSEIPETCIFLVAEVSKLHNGGIVLGLESSCSPVLLRPNSQHSLTKLVPSCQQFVMTITQC